MKSLPVPPPHAHLFTAGIVHPALWLWDSWTHRTADGLSLFCLALPRTDETGARIDPANRNDYRFHVRHFFSRDDGLSFEDRGDYAAPGLHPACEDNIWSGDVFDLDGREAFAFTGIRHVEPNRPFIQSICLRWGDRTVVLSDPVEDYDEIRAAGYWMDAPDRLGDARGEAGGPILAWRDPFHVTDPSGRSHLLWSAKMSPSEPCIAHAPLHTTDDGAVWLGPLGRPIRLPDAGLMTQAEVPKVYEDGDAFLLVVAACDRQYEGQPDQDVTKLTRLYAGPTPFGPWRVNGHAGSRLGGTDHLFGVSLLDTMPHLRLIGAYTELGDPERQLTFPPVRTITRPFSEPTTPARQARSV